MKKPRMFYGWKDGDKFKVSFWPRTSPECRGANTYDTKQAAILDCVTFRTDPGHEDKAPILIWEDDGAPTLG